MPGIRVCDGYAVVALCGELDITGSADAASEIESVAAEWKFVIVDLSALDFIDCGALAAIAGARVLARKAGGDVLLAAPMAAAVQRVIALTAISHALGVYATVAAAAASLDNSPDSWPAGQRSESVVCRAGAAQLRAGPWR